MLTWSKSHHAPSNIRIGLVIHDHALLHAQWTKGLTCQLLIFGMSQLHYLLRIKLAANPEKHMNTWSCVCLASWPMLCIGCLKMLFACNVNNKYLACILMRGGVQTTPMYVYCTWWIPRNYGTRSVSQWCGCRNPTYTHASKLSFCGVHTMYPYHDWKTDVLNPGILNADSLILFCVLMCALLKVYLQVWRWGL